MDRSSEPLTDEERAVFGHDARRAPDGSIIEQGVKVSGSHAQPVFTARANEPLTAADRLVFGEDATRRPDGSIREAGSGHDPDVVAHRNRLEPAAIAAPASVREIDLRTIHPSPERMQ
jgi:hypothetical protein